MNPRNFAFSVGLSADQVACAIVFVAAMEGGGWGFLRTLYCLFVMLHAAQNYRVAGY